MAHHLECCSSSHQCSAGHKHWPGLEEDLGFGFDVGSEVVEAVDSLQDTLDTGSSLAEFVTARDD